METQLPFDRKEATKSMSLHLTSFLHRTTGVYPFTGLDYWTGILDWTTGLNYFPFLDKYLCLF